MSSLLRIIRSSQTPSAIYAVAELVSGNEPEPGNIYAAPSTGQEWKVVNLAFIKPEEHAVNYRALTFNPVLHTGLPEEGMLLDLIY